MILMFCLIGVSFLAPIVLQGQLQFSSIKTALMLAPASLLYVLVTPAAGKLSDVVGSRWLIVSGMLSCSIGIFLLARLGAASDWQTVLPAFLLFGLGIGLVMAPSTSVTMGQVPPERVGNATGILSTSRQVGSVLGVAILGAVMGSQPGGGPLSSVGNLSQTAMADSRHAASTAFLVVAAVCVLGAIGALFIGCGGRNCAAGQPACREVEVAGAPASTR